MKKNNTKKTHPLVRLRRKSRLLWKFTKTSVLDSPWYGRTLFMMALFLLILKMFLMHEAYGAILASNHFLVTVMNYISILSSDFMIVGLVFVGAFLNAMFRHRILRWVINSISLFLMLLYVSDMFSIYYFQSRFYLFDMLQFFSIKNSVTYVMYPFVWAFFFVGILFILFLVVQRWFPVIRQKNMHLRAALVFLGVCTFFSIVNLTSLTDFHFRDNVLSINLQEVSTVLGDTSVNTALEKPYTDYFTPFVGQKRTGDVIVIFAESFSVVDSLKMGGLHNNLSGFDAISKDGLTFSNFIANGCTSETAHIALLQGIEPWEIDQPSSDNYPSYKTYTNALPAFFNSLGYKTVFLSTAPLSFLHQRDFLSGTNFSTIIGEEMFKSRPKYVFDAAPDAALYEKALSVIHDQKSAGKPLFLTMQTISSHKPYSSPAGSTERLAFSYSDAQLKNFYETLKKEGFFTHGTLVIVGDHRKMEPLERYEFEKYGASANGRALMTVIGPGIKPGVVSDEMVQHSDIYSSLKYWYSTGQVLLNTRFNDLFRKYVGRNQAIRYCQYVERQYIATDPTNHTWTISPGTDKQNLAYIDAYKQFQDFTGDAKVLESAEMDALKKRLGLTIIGHQGAPKMEAPESYSSFKRAKEEGADGIEFDLSTTKDGYNVVMHGPDLGRSVCKNSPGKRNVADFTLKQLKDHCVLYNGEPILTYPELLQKTQGRFTYYFTDIKVYDQTQIQQQFNDIFQTVKELGLQDVVYMSSYDATGNVLLRQEGDHFNIALDTYTPADHLLMKDNPYKLFMLPFVSMTGSIVSYVQGLKKDVVTYTINTPEEMQKVYDMGIRMILTDDIPAIVAWMRARTQEEVY